jgi:hypothetical protein
MILGKQPHILNASSNLLGICFVLITGLKITGASEGTLADEISLFSAFCFMSGCVFSYISLRSQKHIASYEALADYSFLAGLFSLFFAGFVFATGIL